MLSVKKFTLIIILFLFKSLIIYCSNHKILKTDNDSLLLTKLTSETNPAKPILNHEEFLEKCSYINFFFG